MPPSSVRYPDPTDPFPASSKFKNWIRNFLRILIFLNKKILSNTDLKLQIQHELIPIKGFGKPQHIPWLSRLRGEIKTFQHILKPLLTLVWNTRTGSQEL
ncbi:hypothetical protein M8J76_004208 [Diaphorina citri]|nr:hypothetical protein M8J76_004208 [Diaphorina citri]